MKEQIKKLAELRKNRDETVGMLKVKKEAFESENEELIAKVKIAKERTELAENVLRKIAESEFERTKEKNFFNGTIKIAETTVIDFEENKAYEWGKKKEMCLMLDKKAFKDLAKATKGRDMPFVKISVVGKGKIVKNIDLDKLE